MGRVSASELDLEMTVLSRSKNAASTRSIVAGSLGTSPAGEVNSGRTPNRHRLAAGGRRQATGGRQLAERCHYSTSWRRGTRAGGRAARPKEVQQMDVCLMIEGQEGVTWEQWLSLALACEEYGFLALFRSDHYVSFGKPHELGSLDAWATLSALAGKTGRIRLGSMVSPVTFRHPSVLAKSVVSADHVSGGRIELGMGAGWFEGEHRAFGFPFPPVAERVEMLEEQVEIVHRLWDRDEEEVSFSGKHYELEACHALPKPVQDPHPPLILGGQAGP